MFNKLLMVAAFAATAALPAQASAFRACEDYNVDTTLEANWPDYTSADRPAGTTPGSFGTKRWSFKYQYTSEGFDLLDVRYGTDPNNRRLVAKRIGMPYLMTRYPQPNNTTNPSVNPTTCGPASGSAFNDTPNPSRLASRLAQFHCAHVPTTVCDFGERRCDLSTNTCVGSPMSCGDDADCVLEPRYGELAPDDCGGSCVTCNGVCAGTQVELGGLELGGSNEQVSGSSEADLVLTTMDHFGGYQFVLRYRFKHDGTLIPSIRFGGVYNVQFHAHIAHWRFELAPGVAGNDVAQRCDSGACGNAVADWSTRGCECAKTDTAAFSRGMWRFYDNGEVSAGAPERSIVIEGGPNDGDPNVCANTDKDYCVLRTDEATFEGLDPNPTDCLDGLNAYVADGCSGGLGGPGPISFWYLGHHDAHNPCSPDEQAFCEPEDGEQAMGPVLKLAGNW